MNEVKCGRPASANFVESKANAQLAIIISHFVAVKNMIQFVLPAPANEARKKYNS